MVLSKMKYVINNLFGIDEITLNENARFIVDLQFDSLDMYQFKKELEYLYKIKLPDADTMFVNWKTLEELSNYIELKLKEKEEKEEKR